MFHKCRRCQKIIAGLCVACTCGALVAASQERERGHEVLMYTNIAWGDLPDSHQENAPPPNPRPISVAVSTSVTVSQGAMVWTPLPSSLSPSSVALFWRAPRLT